jgi:hypothetical protein
VRDSKRNEELRNELARVLAEIDDGLLSFASPDARYEWHALRSTWLDPVAGVAGAGEDLATVVRKVQRFTAILRTLSTPPALEVREGGPEESLRPR